MRTPHYPSYPFLLFHVRHGPWGGKSHRLVMKGSSLQGHEERGQ